MNKVISKMVSRSGPLVFGEQITSGYHWQNLPPHTNVLPGTNVHPVAWAWLQGVVPLLTQRRTGWTIENLTMNTWATSFSKAAVELSAFFIFSTSSVCYSQWINIWASGFATAVTHLPDCKQRLFDDVINASVCMRRNVQQQISVLGDDIHQLTDHFCFVLQRRRIHPTPAVASELRKSYRVTYYAKRDVVQWESTEKSPVKQKRFTLGIVVIHIYSD